MIAKRCDFDLTQCESFNSVTIPDVCKILDMEDQLWTDFMAHTHPRIQCRYKPTTIKVMNATIDAGYVAHFPLDGYMWTFTLKMYKRVGHRKIVLYCQSFDVVVTKIQANRRNSN